jgi:hypothetical protein
MHSALQKITKNAIRYASRIAKNGPSPSSVIPFAKHDRNKHDHANNAMHYTIHYAALSEKENMAFFWLLLVVNCQIRFQFVKKAEKDGGKTRRR